MPSPRLSLPALALAALLSTVAAPSITHADAPRAGGGGANPPAQVRAGRYVLKGTARADLGAWPARDHPVDLLALVAPAGGGDVRLHLWSRGYACELRARVRAKDTLVIAPGQTCRVDFDDPRQRGSVEARLRSGTGRLAEDELALHTVWDVSGSATLSAGGSVTLPGTTVEVPVPAAPPIPVRGTVDAEVRGAREGR